jgi:molecular chaperone GrpE
VAVQVEELREELEELNDRHLRLAAEFDNYRRRSQAQLLKSGVRAQADLVSSLLDALDDFGRVTSVDPETATVESVLEGIALVERKLFQLLEEAGLEELDPAGSAFDPNVMEAMARAPADSQEEDDTVDEVFQKGFRFGGQLVRPARVSVRKFE